MTDTKKIEEAIELLKGVIKEDTPNVVRLVTSANHWNVTLSISEEPGGKELKLTVDTCRVLGQFNLDKTDCFRLVYILGFFANKGRLPKQDELEAP